MAGQDTASREDLRTEGGIETLGPGRGPGEDRKDKEASGGARVQRPVIEIRSKPLEFDKEQFLKDITKAGETPVAEEANAVSEEEPIEALPVVTAVESLGKVVDELTYTAGAIVLVARELSGLRVELDGMFSDEPVLTTAKGITIPQPAGSMLLCKRQQLAEGFSELTRLMQQVMEVAGMIDKVAVLPARPPVAAGLTISAHEIKADRIYPADQFRIDEDETCLNGPGSPPKTGSGVKRDLPPPPPPSEPAYAAGLGFFRPKR